MEIKCNSPYILGLDLGVASLGWALIGLDSGTPNRILRCGVRIFEEGVEGDVESGQDTPRGAKRRLARLARRQTERRARRLKKLFGQLQRAGLLPNGEADGTPLGRQELINQLDCQLSGSLAPILAEPPGRLEILPYSLRALALDEPLDRFALGRALYHLGQRRGFLSNRASGKKDDEEEGVVKPAIESLRAGLATSGARTLGEYFAKLAPVDAAARKIRGRYTSRRMYEEEFEALWNAQAPHHPEILTADLKAALHRTLFYQRPLKSSRRFVGDCEFEEGRKRAPWALLDAQRFRYLQRVNDLRVTGAKGDSRALTEEERRKAISILERQEDVRFSKLRSELKLPRDSRFNLEEGGEKALPGNGTAAAMLKLFGPRWEQLPEEDQARIVDEARLIQKEAVLERRGRERWGLPEEAAKAFARIRLDAGYCNLSRQALRRLLPLLESGLPLSTAVKEVYGERFSGGAELDQLPPVRDALRGLRNPAVERALTETRKVVNAILRRYGKPERIHIEMARDLKRPRGEREKIWKSNRKREKERKEAAAKILAEMKVDRVSESDKEKFLLAVECDWHCPYTGEGISMAALFGPAPRFDVEHIIPRSRSLDDSFANKTLCLVEENRRAKGNRTPFEAYGGDPPRWAEILERVRRFKGEYAAAKLMRFQIEDTSALIDEFTARQLNDTRYASKLAAEYLGLLYGGRDKDGERRIWTSAGQATAVLRTAWDLSKGREEHLHHAVDAMVVALTSASTIKALAEAAQRSDPRRRRIGGLASPWPGFGDEVRRHLDSIAVSIRPQHRLSGALHKETFYGRARVRQENEGEVLEVHFRKPVTNLSKGEVEKIVDKAVREAVRSAFEAAGGDSKKLGDAPHIPYLEGRNGKRTPIRSVRIAEAAGLETIGAGARERQVMTKANHHLAVFAELDPEGRDLRWRGEVVTLLEATRRKRAGRPVVCRAPSDGKMFRFTLMNGDVVRLTGDDGVDRLNVVRGISQYQTGQIVISYALLKDAERDTANLARETIDKLRRRGCRKVTVSPLGDVHPCHD